MYSNQTIGAEAEPGMDTRVFSAVLDENQSLASDIASKVEILIDRFNGHGPKCDDPSVPPPLEGYRNALDFANQTLAVARDRLNALTAMLE